MFTFASARLQERTGVMEDQGENLQYLLCCRNCSHVKVMTSNKWETSVSGKVIFCMFGVMSLRQHVGVYVQNYTTHKYSTHVQHIDNIEYA